MTLGCLGNYTTSSVAVVAAYEYCSLRSKRLSNIGRAVLGNAGGARSTREGTPPRA